MTVCAWPGCDHAAEITYPLGKQAATYELCTPHAKAARDDPQALIDAVSVWAFKCDACDAIDMRQTYATKPRPVAEDVIILTQVGDSGATEWKRPCPSCGGRDWTPVQTPPPK